MFHGRLQRDHNQRRSDGGADQHVPGHPPQGQEQGGRAKLPQTQGIHFLKEIKDLKGSKGIRQWPINRCTFLMMIHKITPSVNL